ncbi:hypothetical protein [Paracoccus sp. (in: a-proteobacteria)]|uniref:hypothetical protein n=1 Tax=Paracoccus sp. TaxID=267 RepID=UPI0026DF8F1D|nr:hypothetical protein [Paracoccus sp. (in: a-proteobacteria)]MDO5648363.1 hypothetical protein [Paracoccus sp. (in: a-proteobacteria)]
MSAVQTAILGQIGAGCLTTGQIIAATGFIPQQVYTACRKLILRDLIARQEIGCFALTDAGREVLDGKRSIRSKIGRAKAPKGRGSLRQRAWNVMAMTSVFTVPDLVTVVCEGAERRASDNLQRFCARLAQAGYLDRLTARAPGARLSSNGFIRYRVRRHTGPVAPSFRPESSAFYDHNLGQEVCCDG